MASDDGAAADPSGFSHAATAGCCTGTRREPGFAGYVDELSVTASRIADSWLRERTGVDVMQGGFTWWNRQGYPADPGIPLTGLRPSSLALGCI